MLYLENEQDETKTESIENDPNQPKLFDVDFDPDQPKLFDLDDEADDEVSAEKIPFDCFKNNSETENS
jgi:hypothetical protein